ncbi:zinc finger BED domain-containing protein RICESLEEPER 1-like isoform X1, partial [Fagus crenata]
MDLSDAVIVNSSRLKSVVWNDFDRVKKGDTCVAVCRHCKKKLSGSSTSGTSHLRNHLIRCQRRSNHGIAQYIAVREKKKEGTLALANFNVDQEQRKDEVLSLVNVKFEQDQMKDETVNTGNNNFDQRRSRFDLARMIILHGYPLAMVEHVGFRVFIKNLQPLFEFVTFNRVEADCMEIYTKEKQKVNEVLDKLPGKISLSADMWAASGDAECLCLMAHYIDESWQLKKKILNFVMVDHSQTEDTHSEDALEVLCEVTHKIRESIQFIKSTQAMQAKFNEVAQEVRVQSKKPLCIDNSSRWNSTYVMLEDALEYREAFSLLQENDPVYTMCPSDIEWERVSLVSSYLKLFVEIINVFTRCKFSTANIYFPELCDIYLQLIEWCKNSDSFISSLASKMRNKFEEYWDRCGSGLAVAAMLDPRFKMKLVEYYYPQIYGSSASERMDDVFHCVKELYNEHSICSPLASLDQGLAWQVGGSTGCSPVSRDRLMGFDKFLHENSQSEGTKSDLDKYLEEPLFPRS